jgi:quercetin dioxygenase-like cupin family protein
MRDEENFMLKTIAVSVGLLFAGGVMLAQQPAITRTVLQKGDLSIAGREVVTVKAEFPISAATGRHTHPGEEATYVVEGTLTLEIEGSPARTVKAGETFFVPAGKIHNATATGGKVTAVANYIVEKGKPLIAPVP